MRFRLGLPLMAMMSLTSPALAEDVSTFALKNGLQVVVIEDHRAPVVVHMVWYRTGAADEAPGKSGIAHFLEHLMFKGTDELAPGELSKVVAKQGGSDNAFTSWDYTAYFQRVAADRLDLMMKMESDRMNDLRLPADQVDPERSVIIEERNQRTDSSPGALLGEQMRAALYLNHPYGIPIIGWKHEMAGLTQADAEAFYAAHYAPDNAILVVAGDVDPEQVKAMAETHYGPIPPAENIQPRNRPSEPPQIAPRRMTLTDERVSEPYISRIYLAPERDPGYQKKAAALVYLAELLGGNGTTSVLARAMQFDSQTAVYTAAGYDGTSLDDTTFSLVVVPLPGVTLEQAEAKLDQVLADFLKTGPDPAAFERVKTQIRAADIYSRDDAEGLANRYGEALATSLTIKDVEDWPDILAAVTPEDVKAAAAEVLDAKRSVTGWLMKEDTAEAGQ
jgi:zinc protease